MVFWSTKHGIGVPSLMVIMHETLKLLHYAEVQDIRFFRIGTSGGLGMTLLSLFTPHTSVLKSVSVCSGILDVLCSVWNIMPCFLKGLISFMVDAYAQAYCSHVKRTNTVVLLSAQCHFPFTSPLGGGVGGGWKCTIYIMSGAVSDSWCIDQSLLFLPKVWSLEQLS